MMKNITKRNLDLMVVNQRIPSPKAVDNLPRHRKAILVLDKYASIAINPILIIISKTFISYMLYRKFRNFGLVWRLRDNFE